MNLTATISARVQIQPENSRISISDARMSGGRFTAVLRGLSVGQDTVRLTATAPGYQTAETSFSVTVGPRAAPPPAPDPIPTDARFRLSFWRAMVFDAHECPRSGRCKEGSSFYPEVEDRVIFVLSTTSPDFAIRTHDSAGNQTFSSSEIATMRREIPRAVEALTGVPFRGQIVSEASAFERNGWVTITQTSSLGDNVCGRARVGASTGRIQIAADSTCPFRQLIAHEIGHAMGFFHTPDQSGLMYPSVTNAGSFSSRERYHAQLAYQFGRGHPYTDGERTATMRRGPDEEEPPEREPRVIICTHH